MSGFVVERPVGPDGLQLQRWTFLLMEVDGIPTLVLDAWGRYVRQTRRHGWKVAPSLTVPSSDLLIEVEGVAHKIGHQQKHDVVRRQLAEAAGWRVLSVLPEQVRDGTAVALIAAALSAKEV